MTKKYLKLVPQDKFMEKHGTLFTLLLLKLMKKLQNNLKYVTIFYLNIIIENIKYFVVVLTNISMKIKK